MSLSPQWLDELRARVTLSAVISRTTRLTKAGREFKACCPFHNEKSPSFTVNDEKGFYHCLAGETLVITSRGRIPIADLAGTTATVLSRNGRWIEAPFREYGVQRLWKIELSRNRQSKVLYATDGHRWFVRGRKSALTTERLVAGHRLEAAFPAVRNAWNPDPAGIQHGIVFGDGTLCKEVYGSVHLHGDKDAELAAWFPDDRHQSKARESGQPYLRVYGGRDFAHMKALPGGEASDDYLLGFLAGYFAADGHVAKDGTVMLNSANGAVLEAVRDMAARLGIGTLGRTTQQRRGLGTELSELHRIHFLSSSLAPEFFLLGEARRRHEAAAKKYERRRWQVRLVEPTDRIEPVFCAEVPDEHAFALDDNLLTGNCFGCGAHGDAIRWMTDQRGLGFMDAVKELASEAGMEVPAPDPHAAKVAEQRGSLHDVMAATQQWFVANLASPEGARAKAYLATRGFDSHTIARFGFGFAPEARQALPQALGNVDPGELIEAGLRIVVDDKEPYDRFRGRLMLPIEDARGRVIAFGGRILDATKTDAPKYLNSPDTPLFDKGRTLYNLHRASPASRQSGRVIVVEGYMDVIALAAAGIDECVAPMGTALTERQLELLWRMVETPILCFDGDAAGQRAALRAIGRALPLLRPAHSLRIVRLPSGLDPDDLLKRDGVRGMEKLLSEARSLLDTLWLHERDLAPLHTPEDKAGLKARLLEHVKVITDQDIQALYRRELMERFSDFAFPPREERPWSPPGRRGTGKTAPPRRTDPASSGRLRRATSGGARQALIDSVVLGLVRWPSEIGEVADAIGALAAEDPRIDLLLEAFERRGELESAAMAAILADKGISLPSSDDQTRLRLPFVMDGYDANEARQALREAIGLLVEQPALEVAMAAAMKRYEQDLTDEARLEHERLRKRKLEFDARLRQMAGARAAEPSGQAPKTMAE